MKPPDAFILEKVRQWLAYADEDLRVARPGFSMPGTPSYRAIAFHAQRVRSVDRRVCGLRLFVDEGDSVLWCGTCHGRDADHRSGGLRYLLASLEHDEAVHCSAMEWMDVDEWYRGRVVLIGDAAHASSPLMGQGGCMAMEDAWVLAEVLRSAATVESALSNYASRRRSRVKWVQQQSIATAENLRMPSTIRNAALRSRGDQMMQSRFETLIPAP